MTDDREHATAEQLRTIDWLHRRCTAVGIDYWLFGGWAVDFHLGRVTRHHADIDVAIWRSDLDAVESWLREQGWHPVVEPDDGDHDADGYVAVERDGHRLELAYLARDDAGVIHTPPLAAGRGEWPAGSFGDARATVDGVQARVVGVSALIEDKSGPRPDPSAAAKDRADAALLHARHPVTSQRRTDDDAGDPASAR